MPPHRRPTRQVLVGNVPVGGDAPLSVQTMTNASAGDVDATLAQIREAADAGCDIIRCAVPSLRNVDAFAAVVRGSPLPVVADIHFDARIAVAAIRAGAAKIRINPGNMGDWDAIDPVLGEAKAHGIPIRIGVNGGSIRHKNPGDTRPLAEALAEEVLAYAHRFEERGFHDIVLSCKASDVQTTIAVNRAVAARCDHPLHLGVTEAGPEEEAILKSAVGIGALLADGIGDTIRLSFTAPPVREVLAGKRLLRAAGCLRDVPELISCPTCGRCTVDLLGLVEAVRARLPEIGAPLRVAVMGCEVNGPGEACDADVGIAAGGGRVTLFVGGTPCGHVELGDAVDALIREARRIAETRA